MGPYDIEPQGYWRDMSTEIKAILRDTWIVGAGYIPVGMAYGVLATSLGASFLHTILFSLFLYAGSMQFLALQLISVHAGLPEIALTTLFVNFRHLFYGISFPLNVIKSRFGKMYSIHALTDETYALLALRDTSQLSEGRILGTELLNQVYWVLGSVLGAVVGNQLTGDMSFMSFGITALFVVLAIDSYKANPRPDILCGAAICAALGLLCGPQVMLAVSLFAFTTFVAIRSYRHVKEG